MTKYDYLIIGGGIAGVTAAETIREQDESSTIGIISDEPHILYSRVLLPAYLKKKIPREKLFLRKIDDFNDKRIDLLLKEKVVFVDPDKREVGLQNRDLIGYGKLLISSGGKVRDWEFEKEYPDSTYRLQTLDDADKLFGALERIKSPVVVGGSFITLEFLDIFALNQISLVLLVKDAYFFEKVLDSYGGEMLRENFQAHNVKVYLNDSVGEVSRKEDKFRVITKSLFEIYGDAFAVGVGVERNMKFVSGSGITLGERGIRVNEFLETSKPDIFAAGDVAEYKDLILGDYRAVGNWTNAFLQGKRVGLNMAGPREPFLCVQAYSITNLGFQITVLGDCGGKDAETLVRLDQSTKRYERFFIKNDVLVGAALINSFNDKPHLTKLIENKTNLESYQEFLKDWKFDIRTIPVA